MPRQKKDAKILNIKLDREIHEQLEQFCDESGLSQILCKHRNAVQIEQNIFKVEVVQAAAALFSK